VALQTRPRIKTEDLDEAEINKYLPGTAAEVLQRTLIGRGSIESAYCFFDQPTLRMFPELKQCFESGWTPPKVFAVREEFVGISRQEFEDSLSKINKGK
jgi:hypothetical protein